MAAARIRQRPWWSCTLPSPVTGFYEVIAQAFDVSVSADGRACQRARSRSARGGIAKPRRAGARFHFSLCLTASAEGKRKGGVRAECPIERGHGLRRMTVIPECVSGRDRRIGITGRVHESLSAEVGGVRKVVGKEVHLGESHIQAHD